MPQKKKTYKLDIFRTLQSLQRKDHAFYENLPQAHKNEFQPLIIMRWLTGTTETDTILKLNQIVNPLVFPLAQHKSLLVRLLSACTSGVVRRTVWNAKPSGPKVLPKASRVVGQYYQYSTKDAYDVLPLLTNDDIVSMAEQLGYQQPEISDLRVELRKRNEKKT